MKKRTFSKEQKPAILKEASEQGVSAVLAKHGIYPATYYSWKQKFEQMCEDGLRHGMTPGSSERDKTAGEREAIAEETAGRERVRGPFKR